MKRKNNDYFQVPNDIFDEVYIVTVKDKQRELSAIEKLIYIYICRCSNNADSAFPSYATIANKCSVTRRTAINAISVLTENNLIQKTWRKNPDTTTKKKNQTNIYKPSISEYSSPSEIGSLLEEEIQEEFLMGGELHALGGEISSPLVVNTVHQGGESDAPRRRTTYKEPIEEEPFIKKEDFSLLKNEPEEGVAVKPDADMKIKITMDMHPGIRIWDMVCNSVYRRHGTTYPVIKINGNELQEITEKLEQIWLSCSGTKLKDKMEYYVDWQLKNKWEPDLLFFVDSLNNNSNFSDPSEPEPIIKVPF